MMIKSNKKIQCYFKLIDKHKRDISKWKEKDKKKENKENFKKRSKNQY